MKSRTCRTALNAVLVNFLFTASRILLLGFSILCWAAVPASAQHFKQIPGSLAQVAAGRSEVWGLNASNQVYRFNSGTKTFAKIGTLTLMHVAVGGGTVLQTDQVWGVTASGKIYRFNYKTNTFTQVPGTLAQIVVGEGNADTDKCHPYEVWGLNAAELIYRYNYCTSRFDQIAGSLTVIATGGGDVWGLNGSAQIYYYQFYGNQFIQVPGSLQQITVGASDVWGLDGDFNVYRFDSVSGEFVLSRLGGFTLYQIAAGGDGVWGIFYGYGLSPNSIFRLKSHSCGCIVNDSDFRIFLAQIAVGYGAGVWGVNYSHQVFAFVRP